MPAAAEIGNRRLPAAPALVLGTWAVEPPEACGGSPPHPPCGYLLAGEQEMKAPGRRDERGRITNRSPSPGWEREE